MAGALIERLAPLSEAEREVVLGAMSRSAVDDITRVTASLADVPDMDPSEQRIRLAVLVDSYRDLCDAVEARLHFEGGG